jgi:hypothetical protein
MGSIRGDGVRPLLALYDALVARFGVAADERFAVVLNNITKARRQRYNAAYPVPVRRTTPGRWRSGSPEPRTSAQQDAERAGRAAYMKRYRSAVKTEVAG